LRKPESARISHCRQKLSQYILNNERISPVSKGYQLLTRVGAGTAADIGSDVVGSLASGVDNLLLNAPSTAMKYAGSAVGSLPIPLDERNLGQFAGETAANVGGAVQQGAKAFENYSPELYGNVAGSFDFINGLLTLAGGYGAAKAGTEVLKQGAKTVTKAAGKQVAKQGMRVLKGTNELIDTGAQKLSRAGARASLSPEMQAIPGIEKLSDAEVLFIKEIQDAGLPLEQAAKTLRSFKSQGLTPNVGIALDLGRMEQQTRLVSKGTVASPIAKQALQDIQEVQIPKLTRKIIKQATGGKLESAEDYGTTVAAAAKNLVEKSRQQLKTQAKPFYEASVGADKIIPKNSPALREVRNSPKAMQAINSWRTDVDVLENVQNDLGISMARVVEIPENSTVSLHAARVALSKQSQANISGPEKEAIKSAIRKIDNAIKSEFPEYGVAVSTYSDNAKSLKTLMDSPVGKMSEMADGNFSKVANELMKKDSKYIKKFIKSIDDSGLENPQAMKDSLAGAYLSSVLEKGKGELSFRKTILGGIGGRDNLKALVGDKRFNQIIKTSSILDNMVESARTMVAGADTAGNFMAAGGSLSGLPTGVRDAIGKVFEKFNPEIFDVISKNPEQIKKYAKLLTSNEGIELLEKISKGTMHTAKDYEAVGEFLKNVKIEGVNLAPAANDLTKATRKIKRAINK
jgi:hypothetical protein